MKAFGFYSKGDNRVMEELEIDKPSPSDDEILVKVKAVSFNPVDYLVLDFANTDKLNIAGFDCAGVVEEVGSNVKYFKKGDEVYYSAEDCLPCSNHFNGCNQEYHAINELLVGRKPRNINFLEAASLPLTSLTVWECLFDGMKIDENGKDAGKSIVILAGAGGTGSIAIQLAKQVGKLKVIALTSTKKVQWCKDMGADHVIDYKTEDLVKKVRELGLENKIDYVLSCTNINNYIEKIGDIVKPFGASIGIVAHSGKIDYASDTRCVTAFSTKSVSIFFEFMITRVHYKTEDMIRVKDILNKLSELIEGGYIKSTFNLEASKEFTKLSTENLHKVYGLLKEGHVMGKIAINFN